MDGRAPHRTLDGDLEGLDPSQRAEVHSYEGGGPNDGTVLTDLSRDRGEDFVEDERASELMSGAPERYGMTEEDGTFIDSLIDEDGAETADETEREATGNG